MKKIMIILAIGLITFNLSVKADHHFEMPFSIGLYGGLNFNMHNPSFTFSPNATDFRIKSLQYNTNNNSLGFNAGGIINIPISDVFVFSGRVGYNTLSGTLETSTTSLQTGDTIFRPSSLDASIAYLEITPALQIHNVLLDRLYFLAGLEFGLPLSEEYEYSESQSITNQSLTTTRTEKTDIPDKNLRFALALGLGYIFNLSDGIMLAPELSYRLPFTRVSAANKFDAWEVPQIRLGLNLLFGSSKKEPKPDDPLSFFDVGFKEVNYYDREGNKRPLNRLTVEEVQYKELFPLVPYVFYEENKSEPVREYQTLNGERKTGQFTMDALKPEALDINRQTLDIIGARLRGNNRATLTITGTNDDIGEARNMALSGQRADFAKNYLVNNYGIDANRITTRQSGLPAKPSSKRDPDGVMENRRVEFTSNDESILQPIIIAGDKQAVPNPDNIEFVTFAESSEPIEEWELEIYQSDRLLKKFTGTGEPESVRWQLSPNSLSPGAIPLEYTFKAKNTKGKTKNANGNLPVDFVSFTRKKTEDRPDQTISKFSLILFDFDSDAISEQDRKIINEHIIPEIKFNSTVKIYGYTDRIGLEDYNKQLAERRANQVMRILKEKAPTAKFEVFGVGERNLIFDNDSPVGRHLSRTVQIYVSTPKN